MYANASDKLKKIGWKGQYPPYQFEKLKTPTTIESPKKIPKIPEIVGAKLAKVSPIEKMSKAIILVPEISKDSCLECGRCYVACSDSGYQAI